MCSKMNKCMYFLKQLKWAGVSMSDLLCFYKAVIRPVAEYACPVWHSSLTVDQSDHVELIQCWVMKIIFTDCAYTDACRLANLPSLVDRREQLTRRFFSTICDANNCLHYLLPEQHDSCITNSLRTAKKYPVPFGKTTRFKNSFILYALANFQWL